MYLKIPLDQYEYMRMPLQPLGTISLQTAICMRKPSIAMLTWKFNGHVWFTTDGLTGKQTPLEMIFVPWLL
jgi:hypothetical protein